MRTCSEKIKWHGDTPLGRIPSARPHSSCLGGLSIRCLESGNRISNASDNRLHFRRQRQRRLLPTDNAQRISEAPEVDGAGEACQARANDENIRTIGHAFQSERAQKTIKRDYIGFEYLSMGCDWFTYRAQCSADFSHSSSGPTLFIRTGHVA